MTRQPVDFVAVSTAGLESSPVADALAGLRANEARYFKNKYDIVFATEPAQDDPELVEYVARVLQERDIVIVARPVEVTKIRPLVVYCLSEPFPGMRTFQDRPLTTL